MESGFGMGQEMGMGFEAPEYGRNRRRRTKEVRLPETDNFWSEFSGEHAETYEKFWRPEERKSYLEQGVEFIDQVHERNPDTIVFMDKSARPLGGFFLALWQRLYPGESPPAMRFMVGLRRGETHPPEKIVEALGASTNVFEGKKVLVLDEIAETGKTLMGAADSLKEAFPGIKESMLGAMAKEGTKKLRALDISEPIGAFYYEGDASNLGIVLYKLGKYVQETKDENGDPNVLSEPIRGLPPESNPSLLLRQVGLHETFDEHSLSAIETRVKNDADESWSEDTKRLRDLYVKLIKKGTEFVVDESGKKPAGIDGDAS